MAELLIRFVETTGPAGAIIAAIIVGLGLVVIIYARTHNLFSSTRTADQQGELLDHFVQEVDRLALAEKDLRRDLAAREAEQGRLKDKQRDLEAKIELTRAALRRAIDMLRAVREGRLAPAAIEGIDTMDPPP